MNRACEPGATQFCVGLTGAGECSGVQLCAADGSGWGACNCGAGVGGSAGGAGAAGTLNAGSAGVDASAGTSGAGGIAGMSGMSNDGGFDAAEAAPPQDAGPLDDPCPGSSTVNVNCSNLCQPTDTKICNALVNCSPVTSAEATVKKLPFRIRLPANPALTCGCKIEDGSAGPLQYTLWFAVPGSVSQQLRAIVKAPWYVREIWTPENDACVDDKFSFWRAGCTNLLPTSQYNWIGVGTNDPNAPSRVLTVSSATAATSCSDYYWK